MPTVRIRDKLVTYEHTTRNIKHKPLQGKIAVSHDPRVVGWVRACYDRGWVRDQIVEASVNGTDGWPLPGEHLTNGGVSECRAAIAALQRVESEGKPPARRKSQTKAQLREAKAVKKNGNLSVLIDLRIKLLEMLAQTETVNLADYMDELDPLAEQEFVDIHEDLVRFRVWMDVTSAIVQSRVSDAKKREMIRHLREDNDGFEPAEVEMRLREAERQERAMNNRLAA